MVSKVADGPPGGLWIREARLRARLSQKELADRLQTSQSLVARWERGVVDPRFSTVVRAVRACGFDLATRVVNYDSDHDIELKRNLRLSPEERLHRMRHIAERFEKLHPRPRADADS